MAWFRFRWPKHVDTGPVTSYVREKMAEASWSDPAQREYIRVLRQIEDFHGGPFPGGLGRMAQAAHARAHPVEAEVIRAELMDGRVISEEEARHALLVRRAQETFRQAGERKRERQEQEVLQEEERRAWLAAGGRP